MTIAERVLVLTSVTLVVLGLVALGRVLARRHLDRLRQRHAAHVWWALDAEPDGRPTVVAFSTPGCGVCRSAQRPALAALQAVAPRPVRVIHVDAADRHEVARAFGVMTVPATFVLDDDGRVVAANQGLATADRLAAQLGFSS